jgi:hypothetical protein
VLFLEDLASRAGAFPEKRGALIGENTTRAAHEPAVLTRKTEAQKSVQKSGVVSSCILLFVSEQTKALCAC